MLPETTPDTAPALVVTAHGGSDRFAVEERAVPEPGPGELLVHVAASGVNFIDIYQREGTYPMDTPFVLGMEGAGEVVATGPGVTQHIVGDRVAWAMVGGSAARYAVVPAERAVTVRADVPLDLAAAVLLQGMTAQFLAHSAYPVARGTTALVHAAAGGVGQLLVQMLHRLGAQVIAVAGGPDKGETARERGADHVIDSLATDGLAAAVREHTEGRGVDVVFDGVGQATFDASLASLRPRGLLCVYGAASGPVPPLDIQRLNAAGSVYLTRPSLAHYIATPEDLRRRASDVYSMIASGLVVEVGGRYPLEEAAAAYDALAARQTQGKLLLIP